eukprot:gene13418-biopygen11247
MSSADVQCRCPVQMSSADVQCRCPVQMSSADVQCRRLDVIRKVGSGGRGAALFSPFSTARPRTPQRSASPDSAPCVERRRVAAQPSDGSGFGGRRIS